MKKLILGTCWFLSVLWTVPSFAADTDWYDNEGPDVVGTEYNYFDSTHWNGGALPSDGDNVSIRLLIPWDLSDPLDVPNILRNQDYAIGFDPLSNSGEPNSVNYNTFDFRSTSQGNATFTQQSGTITVGNIFRVGGGLPSIEMLDVGGEDYYFGGESTYRMEGGTLDLRNALSVSQVGASGPSGVPGGANGSEGYNARFELAGGTVIGSLSIGENGNGSYLQTGGVFLGHSLSVGRDEAYTGDRPQDLTTPSLTLEGGLIGVEYLTAGNYHSSANINLTGGTLNLLASINPFSNIKIGANTAASMIIDGSARINPDANLNLSGGLGIYQIDGVASTVTQGGTSVARFLSVQNEGRYVINSGFLESKVINNFGEFTQNGGTVRATKTWKEYTGGNGGYWTGGNLTSTGRYTMNGGELSASLINASGPFNMNGGIINAEVIVSDNFFRMNGGLINTGTLAANGSFDMSNGTVSTGSLSVGANDGSAVTFDQTGGAVLAGIFRSASSYVGTRITNGGKYNLSNGSLTSAEMWVDAGGSFNQTGGVSSVGNLNNSGHVIVRGADIRMNDLLNEGNANFLSDSVVTIDGSIVNGSSAVLNFGGLTSPATVAGASENSGALNTVYSNITFEDTYLEKGSFKSIGSNTTFKDLTIDEGGLVELTLNSTAQVQSQLIVGDTSQGRLEVKGNSVLSVLSGIAAYKFIVGNGAGSYGELSITDGGTVNAGKYLHLGKDVNSYGAIVIGEGGNLHTTIEAIGDRGVGELNQTGGTHTISNNMYLYANGTYNLSNGNLEAAKESIYGGTFNQTGGTNTLNGTLSVTGAGGTYNLDGGSLSAGGITLAEGWGSPTGTFNQTGGTNNSGNNLQIQSGGTYRLSGGALTSWFETIGGLFIQDGGTNTLNDKPWGASLLSVFGTYNLNDGDLSSSTENVTGVFNQSGGTNVVNTNLHILEHNSGTHSGEYNYSGGLLTAKNIVNDGNFNLSGAGTRTVNGNFTNNGTVEATDTKAVFTGGFTNTERVQIASGSTVTMTGDYRQTDEMKDGAETKVNGTMIAETLIFESGLLSGSGDIFGDVQMLGDSVIGPGNSPGVLSIYGDFFLGAGATYTIEIGDYAAMEYDKLLIEGIATIEDGAIFDILFLDTFDPLEVFAWDFIDANDFIFGDLNNIIFNVSYSWDGDFDYPMNFADGFNTIDVSTGPSPVPAPATFWLFGTGLIGLIRFNKRKKTITAKP